MEDFISVLAFAHVDCTRLEGTIISELFTMPSSWKGPVRDVWNEYVLSTVRREKKAFALERLPATQSVWRARQECFVFTSG